MLTFEVSTIMHSDVQRYLSLKAIAVINLTLAIQFCSSLCVFALLHTVKQQVCETEILQYTIHTLTSRFESRPLLVK